MLHEVTRVILREDGSPDAILSGCLASVSPPRFGTDARDESWASCELRVRAKKKTHDAVGHVAGAATAALANSRSTHHGAEAAE